MVNANFDQKLDWAKAESFYDFHALDIDGNDVSMEKYRGYLTIVVNIATKCGLAKKHYKQFASLHEKYKDLKIIGFPTIKPSTPENGQQLKDVLVNKFDVKFDIMDKIEVNGDDAHPIYKWLKSFKLYENDDININFFKYLIGKDGKIIKLFEPMIYPDDMEPELVEYLK